MLSLFFYKYISDKQKKSMSDALSKCTYGTLQQTESRSVTSKYNHVNYKIKQNNQRNAKKK